MYPIVVFNCCDYVWCFLVGILFSPRNFQELVWFYGLQEMSNGDRDEGVTNMSESEKEERVTR
jgi:hypothetical protein